MQVIGHRGVIGEGLTENTWESFQAAADLGVDGIETDVRRSRDGRLVLFHDRLAANGAPIAELDHAELQRVEGYAVPELHQVLATWPRLLWNLEIKTTGFVEPLMDALCGLPEPDLVISSAYHNLIHDCADALHFPLGLIVKHRPVSMAGLLRDWHARPLHWCVWDLGFVDQEVLAVTADHGIHNVVYDVHTENDLRLARQWALDAVILDQPELALGSKREGAS
jgi:glycerophosphoryl diester phosphodiesterase